MKPGKTNPSRSLGISPRETAHLHMLSLYGCGRASGCLLTGLEVVSKVPRFDHASAPCLQEQAPNERYARFTPNRSRPSRNALSQQRQGRDVIPEQPGGKFPCDYGNFPNHRDVNTPVKGASKKRKIAAGEGCGRRFQRLFRWRRWAVAQLSGPSRARRVRLGTSGRAGSISARRSS